jgi:hypothetical protein
MTTVNLSNLEALLEHAKGELSKPKVSKACKTRCRKHLLELKKECDAVRKALLSKPTTEPVPIVETSVDEPVPEKNE